MTALLKEMNELEESGVEVKSRLKISPGCPLILPYHIELDNAREAHRGKAAIGTTGMELVQPMKIRSLEEVLE